MQCKDFVIKSFSFQRPYIVIKPSTPLESKLYVMVLRIFMLLTVEAPTLKKKNQNNLHSSILLCVSCFFNICNPKAFAILNCADLKFQSSIARGNCYRTNVP